MTTELILKNLFNLPDHVIKDIVVEAYANHEASKRQRYFIVEADDIEVHKLYGEVFIKKVEDPLKYFMCFTFDTGNQRHDNYFWDDDGDMQRLDASYLIPIIRKYKIASL
jgi:hypothetical protein